MQLQENLEGTRERNIQFEGGDEDVKKRRRKIGAIIGITAVLVIFLIILIIVIVAIARQSANISSGITNTTSIASSSNTTGNFTNLVPTWTDSKLPTWQIPSSYFLEIEVNTTTLSFCGNVSINFTLNQNTSLVVLHGEGLLVTSAQIMMFDPTNGSMGSIVSADYIGYDVNREYILLNFNYLSSISQARPLQLTLTIIYQGFLSQTLEGLYVTSYTKLDGTTDLLIASHVDPIGARLVLPCLYPFQKKKI